VRPQFRHIAIAAALVSALSASAALAQWPSARPVARLDPGYGGVCEACDLSGRILAGARMSNSIFNGSDFSQAVMTRVDGSNSEFERADFTEADISYANFVRARFAGAVFDRAKLAHVVAHGADLRGARGLTQRQLRGSCGDGATQLPRGLRVAACG